MIADLWCFTTKFTDVNQSVLLDANINEASKRCYIWNGPRQHRSCLQIGHFLYATLEQRFHVGVVTIVSVQFTAQCLQYTAQLNGQWNVRKIMKYSSGHSSYSLSRSPILSTQSVHIRFIFLGIIPNFRNKQWRTDLLQCAAHFFDDFLCHIVTLRMHPCGIEHTILLAAQRNICCQWFDANETGTLEKCDWSNWFDLQ